jgi:hypothetical protein
LHTPGAPYQRSAGIGTGADIEPETMTGCDISVRWMLSIEKGRWKLEVNLPFVIAYPPA